MTDVCQAVQCNISVFLCYTKTWNSRNAKHVTASRRNREKTWVKCVLCIVTINEDYDDDEDYDDNKDDDVVDDDDYDDKEGADKEGGRPLCVSLLPVSCSTSAALD